MKVAISVPDKVFDAAERLARQRAVPRSRLFTEALQEYVSRHGADAVTEQLDSVYASETAGIEAALANAQLASVAHEAW